MMITPTTTLPTMHEGVGLAAAAERNAVTPMATTTFEATMLDIPPVGDSARAYKRDITPYTRFSSLPLEQRETYEQSLVAKAREGCAQARERLITHLSCLVVRQAERYFYTYGWLHPTMELSDLIQAGNMTLLEKLEKALSKSDPCAYLLACTSATIRSVRFTDTLIPTPTSCSVQPRFCSLDQPLSPTDERPLVEVLAAPSASCGDERDVSALYQAIDALTEQQRQTILRRYGLCGMPEQAQHEIDQALHGGRPLSRGAEKRALCALAALLKSTYLGEDESEVILSKPVHVAPDCQGRTLTDEERARLDTACAALLARGERITHRALRKEARIGSACASAYLYQRGLSRPPDRLERLRAAHATMAAQGVSMTVHELARVAHVDRALAHTYLRQLGMVSDRQAHHCKEAVQARLDQVYETLRAEHRQVQVSALMKAAHVTHRVAAPYLEERRAAEGLQPCTPPRRLPPPAHHDERQQLLADVYEEMLQHGVPIRLDRLCNASGLRIHEVRAFLAERGMTWEQQQERARTERLEAAYAQWLEHEQQPPPVEWLTKAAQVKYNHARSFLAEHGMTRKARQAQECMARLQAAYTHLVEQGQPVGVTLLAATAYVGKKRARRFLAEKQRQAKGTQA